MRGCWAGGRAMGRPLLAASAVFAAAAYLGLGRDFGLVVALACCAAAAGSLAALRWRPAAALGVCAALGFLRGGSVGPPARDAALDAALIDPTLDRGGREPVRVEGTVLEAEPRPRGLSVVLRIERLEPRPADPLHEPSEPPRALILVERGAAIGRGARVALLVRSLAKRLWLRGPWAGRARAAAVASLCAAPAIAAEVFLLGAPWPAVRAGVGAGLALAADLCGRRADGLTTLFVAAAACALLDPAATHDLALQLSVAGVAGMLVLADPLRDFFPRPLPRLPGSGRLPEIAGRIAEHAVRLSCATAAATLCTGPLIAAAFHRVSLATVAANPIGLAPGLLAIPIASLAVPVDALVRPAALPLFSAADHLAGLTLLAARGFAALPYARIVVAAPAPWTAVLWWAAALLLSGWPAPLAAGSPPRRPAPRTRIRRALLPALALLCTGVVHPPPARLSRPLRGPLFPVGQGGAAPRQLPGGRALPVAGRGALRGPAPPRKG